MSEELQYIDIAEQSESLTDTQNYIWQFLCVGLSNKHIADLLQVTENDVNEAIFGDSPDSMTSKFGIDTSYREPHTTLALLGFASGLAQVPEPEVIILYQTNSIPGQSYFQLPTINFGTGATPIFEHMAKGYNNVHIANLLSTSVPKVIKKLGQVYGSGKLACPSEDNARLIYMINMLASDSYGDTNIEHHYLQEFVAEWNKEHDLA